MELMESTSLVMARAVQDLHKLIETKCNPNNPIETMVLMMGFATGITLPSKKCFLEKLSNFYIFKLLNYLNFKS
jgi:hypothetical protein